MDDTLRAEKLAAAKKKLKRYQKKSGKSKVKSASGTTSDNDDQHRDLDGHYPEKMMKRDFNGVMSVESTLMQSSCDETERTHLYKETNSDSGLSTDNFTEYASGATERLLQLSQRINGIINPREGDKSREKSADSLLQELEQRNVELAGQLGESRRREESVLRQLVRSREDQARRDQRWSQERDDLSVGHQRELQGLMRRLEEKCKSVGLLVAEKAELDGQLAQAERSLHHRVEEAEGLAGQLRSARLRIDKLERSSLASSTAANSPRYSRCSSPTGSTADHQDMDEEVARVVRSRDQLADQLTNQRREFHQLEMTVIDLQQQLKMSKETISRQTAREANHLSVISRLENEHDSSIDRINASDLAVKLANQDRDRVVEEYGGRVSQLTGQVIELRNDLVRERALVKQPAIVQDAFTTMDEPPLSNEAHDDSIKVETFCNENHVETCEKQTNTANLQDESFFGSLDFDSISSRHENLRDSVDLGSSETVIQTPEQARINQELIACKSQVAELCSENAQLHHIIEQLAGEADTIGEYIGLFHSERARLEAKWRQKEARMRDDCVWLEARVRELEVSAGTYGSSSSNGCISPSVSIGSICASDDPIQSGRSTPVDVLQTDQLTSSHISHNNNTIKVCDGSFVPCVNCKCCSDNMSTLPQSGLYFRHDWYTTPEASASLDALYPNRAAGRCNRNYGLLDKPKLPTRTVDNQAFTYKIFLRGKAGVGKSSTLARLTGLTVPINHYQTPGVSVNHIYWPCKHIDGRIIVIQLQFWDTGDTAISKFPHMLPSMKEKADGVIFVFSFVDRSSFEDVPHMMARTVEHSEDLCKFVFGTKVDHAACQQVSLRAIRDFERSWRLPVHRLSNMTSSPASDNDLAATLVPLCESLWHRDQVLAGILH